MPKLIAPCLAIRARGTLGRILTFLDTARGAVCKRKPTVPDAETPDQKYRRYMFAFLQKNWSALEEEDKETWRALATSRRLNRNNVYLATNLQRWDRYLPPSAYLPISQLGTVGTRGVYSRDIGPEIVEWSFSLNAVNQNWGVIFFVNENTAPTWLPEQIYHIELHNSTDIIQHTWKPPHDGTWRFRTAYFTHNGEQVNQPHTRVVIFPPP